MTRRIATAWAGFERAVVPPDANRIQRQEMRRSFYAGAHAFLGILMRQLSETDEVAPEDLDMMDEIEAELEAFMRDVLEGRA